MLDNSPMVFEVVSSALRTVYTDIFIIGEEITSAPPSFPAVSIVQTDNQINTRYSTFDNRENVVTEDYKIEVYSNKQAGRAKQAAEIAALVCDEMDRLGYVRTFNQPIVNADATVSRRVLRFRKSNVTEVI